MKVQQSFDVDHPAETVWQALSDLELVAACMPGAELTGRDGDDYTGRIGVKLGPITARFSGKATIRRDDESHRGSVDGQGTDTGSGSRASASLSYAVEETGPASSRVSVDSDIKLSGSLAQFGRSGIVNDVTRQLTHDFSANLQARLNRPAEQGGEAAEAPQPQPAGEIEGFGLLFSVLWRRLVAPFRKLFGGGRDKGT